MQHSSGNVGRSIRPSRRFMVEVTIPALALIGVVSVGASLHAGRVADVPLAAYQANVDPFSGKVTDRLAGAGEAAASRLTSLPVLAATKLVVTDGRAWSETPLAAEPRRSRVVAQSLPPDVPMPPERPAARDSLPTAPVTTAAAQAPASDSLTTLAGWTQPVATALSPRQWLAGGSAAVRRVADLGGAVIDRISP